MSFEPMRPRGPLPRGLALAAGVTLLGGCALFHGHADNGPGLLTTDDLTTHCHRLWPADHDSFRLCQQLQNRSRLRLSTYAGNQGINSDNLDRKARHGNKNAQAIRACLGRFRPDYTSVWRCVEERRQPAESG